MAGLTAETAARFAAVALGHVTRAYPHKPDHVLADADDRRAPQELHPVFHGSFDWHSCVHGFWMLARLLRRFPAMAPAAEIRRLFDRQFTADKVAAECAYLRAPATRGFERPYGWAWLLKLAAEPDGERLAPLAEMFAQRFRDFLPIATYPGRAGTHSNTAFALRLAADYAAATDDETLMSLLRETALRWYGADAACPAWGEPSGDDFLSPALIEAECLRRLVPPEEFSPWFDRFLPDILGQQPPVLYRPAVVSDRSDGKIAHLDGLNLSRAWCWRSLAGALPNDDRRRAIMLAAAESHLASGLPHIAGDYMGEHWLASFAVLALD